MRIGQFAKKHGVTQDTIRYYIEKELLVPNKEEGQYRFSEVDSKEIEKIIELKQMHFSLADVHRILTFQRIGGASTEFSRKLFLLILEEKQIHIKEELSKFNRINDYLTKQIEEIKSYGKIEEQVLGFPIASMELLVCPSCNKGVNLSAGVIEKNMIINAEVECECGYKANIKDGIYIDERDVRTKLVNGKPMPSKEEYLMQTSHNHISHLFKGMAKVIDFILKYHKEPKYIMELSNCVGFFLLQYINYLPEDTVYILIDFDIDRITHLKKNLEQFYSHKKFIFLCCEYRNLPLKKLSVDVVVDLFMSNVYESENNENIIDFIALFLKHKGVLAGAHRYGNTKEIEDERLGVIEKGYDKKETMLEKTITSSGIKVLESLKITTAMKDNSQHKKGKQVEEDQHVYVGKKY